MILFAFKSAATLLWLTVKACEHETNFEEAEKPESRDCCSSFNKAMAYAAVGAVTIQGAFYLFGFGQGGITTDSKAARIQSRRGNVAKDSAFSKSQSIGMRKILGLQAPLVIGAVLGVIIAYMN